jgi:hypothetical protein
MPILTLWPTPVPADSHDTSVRTVSRLPSGKLQEVMQVVLKPVSSHGTAGSATFVDGKQTSVTPPT